MPLAHPGGLHAFVPQGNAEPVSSSAPDIMEVEMSRVIGEESGDRLFGL